MHKIRNTKREVTIEIEGIKIIIINTDKFENFRHNGWFLGKYKLIQEK